MTWTKFSPVLTLLALLVQGCSIYSFSGTSLPPEAKTFSLQFQSEVLLGPTGLATRLQQQLGDTLVQRTTLRQVDGKGNLQIEGSIKQFTYYASIAPTKSSTRDQGQQTPIEQLTIAVELSYTNPYNEAASFSKRIFLQNADMTAHTNSSNVEHKLIDTIFADLVEDIFNATVANW